MAKLESTIRNMVLSLVIITSLAAAALAGVYQITKQSIATSEKARQEESVMKVLPPFDNSPLDESYKAATPDGDSLTIYPAKKAGKITGVAVESFTHKGFGGLIRIMVGFNADGTVRNYEVLHHTETPGLGSKMEEWFHDRTKNGQSIIGRNPSVPLKVSKDGGDVDAITAATISSRAFLDGINRAYQAFRPKASQPDAETSASKHEY